MNDSEIFSEWIYQTNKNLNIVLDIGANVGDFFGLIKHKKINQFHYFEPDEDNFKLCQSRLSQYKNTIGHNYGIFYGKNISKVQGIGDNNTGGYMVSEINEKFKDEIWGDRLVYYPEKIFKLKKIEDVIKEPIDMVKIDVQGAELDILKGMPKALSNVKHLIVELQHVEYNIGAKQLEQSIPFIESLGFKLAPSSTIYKNNLNKYFSAGGPDADYHFIKSE